MDVCSWANGSLVNGSCGVVGKYGIGGGASGSTGCIKDNDNDNDNDFINIYDINDNDIDALKVLKVSLIGANCAKITSKIYK